MRNQIDLVQEKKVLRKKFRSLRANLENRDDLSAQAVHNVCQLPEWKTAKCVLLYSPVGSEIDSTLLLQIAQTEKKQVLLPVTLDCDGTMSVGFYTNSDSLTIGNYSIPEPSPIENFDYTSIDLILIPGIAFDKTGGRLGQGKGFYDRFIEKSEALLVGFAFSEQISESLLPMDSHDKRVDYIITDKGIVKCSG